eukprot:6456737-Pyramimonas_sp.AAC.1
MVVRTKIRSKGGYTEGGVHLQHKGLLPACRSGEGEGASVRADEQASKAVGAAGCKIERGESGAQCVPYRRSTTATMLCKSV